MIRKFKKLIITFIPLVGIAFSVAAEYSDVNVRGMQAEGEAKYKEFGPREAIDYLSRSFDPTLATLKQKMRIHRELARYLAMERDWSTAASYLALYEAELDSLSFFEKDRFYRLYSQILYFAERFDKAKAVVSDWKVFRQSTKRKELTGGDKILAQAISDAMGSVESGYTPERAELVDNLKDAEARLVVRVNPPSSTKPKKGDVCFAEFDVTATGIVDESTLKVSTNRKSDRLRKSCVRSFNKFKYIPKVENGRAVTMRGVSVSFTFGKNRKWLFKQLN